MKHQDWTEKYLQRFYGLRLTLDGPVGSMMGTKLHFDSYISKVELELMVWGGIITGEVVGPFQVEDGLKINSQNDCRFQRTLSSGSGTEKSLHLSRRP